MRGRLLHTYETVGRGRRRSSISTGTARIWSIADLDIRIDSSGLSIRLQPWNIPDTDFSDGPFGEEGCYENAHALYDYLVKDRATLPEDIVVIGCSLGSGVAIELASTRPVGALVLEVAFYSGAREAMEMADRFGLGMTKSLLAGIRKFPSAERIKRITCPVLSIRGTADEVVPFSQGRDLYANAPNGYGFVEVPGASHCGFIADLGERQYERLIVRFVESIS